MSSLQIPAEIALTSLTAYLIGFHFTALSPGYLPKIGGQWAAIAAIEVNQSSRRETTSSASLRIIGSAVGALISALYLSFLPFHPVGMAAVLFATVVI